MAAVWKLWKNPKTELWERTFAILTGDPNELMAPIHDRMTTFLEPRDLRGISCPSGASSRASSAHLAPQKRCTLSWLRKVQSRMPRSISSTVSEGHPPVTSY